MPENLSEVTIENLEEIAQYGRKAWEDFFGKLRVSDQYSEIMNWFEEETRRGE